ncbi:ABC transporter substrate-binding protein [Clostridium magnum]|uniref:Putative arabinose-binding protein n=1 Tax=Clostridium magnum DSM 2767 TaxID=1121326 RepID=A0A162RKK2_9CLOT|nr:extracellular solute-binding protein [Clostridium magnum]KZL90043.1 putative arabinose-binding protein precursor [Clostridium magnum DSM 2767]SHH58320.1 multiple sugar transport system substrate-binding protein [Clostridium magnum DSM 2767]
MRKNVRILSLFICIAILVSVVACNSEKKVENKDNLKGKIVVLTDKKHEGQLKLAADNFKKLHPKAEIDLRVENILYDKLKDDLNAKENPIDVVNCDNEHIQYLINKLPNSFLDVTEDVGAYKDKLAKSKIDNLTFNSKIYGFPWNTSPKVILYRSDILLKEGINPDDIKTWSDYIYVGKKVSNDTGKRFMANSNDINSNIYLLLANELGTSYLNKDGKLNFNSKEWNLTLQVAKSLYTEGILYELSSKEAVIEAAKRDEIVSFVADPSYASSLMESSPEYKGKWAVMKLPAFESGGNRDISLGGSSLMINKASENTNLAKEFIKFSITDDKTQMGNMNKYGLFPVNIDQYNLVEFNKSIDYFNSRIWYLFGDVEKGAPIVNYTLDFSTIGEVVENNLSKDNLASKEIPVLLELLQKESESRIVKK